MQLEHPVRAALAAMALLIPGTALAHAEGGLAAGLGSGFAHPLLGLDHLLAMFAVGLWAVQSGGRALWALPVAFVAAMILGGALAVGGVGLPLVEIGIATSVLLLGVAVAWGRALPLAVSVAAVAVLALFHGHAHGTEMPLAASGLTYGSGFALATALLHGAGLVTAQACRRISVAPLLRGLGVATALAGAWLVAA